MLLAAELLLQVEEDAMEACVAMETHSVGIIVHSDSRKSDH